VSAILPPRPDEALDADQLELLRSGLYLIALRALRNSAAAEEAAQESLTRAVVALRENRLRDPEKLGAFVRGIARHVIMDALRSSRRVGPSEAVNEAVDPVPDALEHVVSSDERARLHAALGGLRAIDRELLRLCFFEGLTPDDIARRLGEPAERIRKRKSRALERLRQVLVQPRPSTTLRSTL
jgi:RNA polymerase sigma factor (sigma-70 family)